MPWLAWERPTESHEHFVSLILPPPLRLPPRAGAYLILSSARTEQRKDLRIDLVLDYLAVGPLQLYGFARRGIVVSDSCHIAASSVAI